MPRSDTARLDLAPRPGNLPAILVLLAACGVALGMHHSAGRVALEESMPIDPQKVRQADLKVDPNVASVASLRRLPEIGKATARAIVDHRLVSQASGGPRAFSTVGDLLKVKGFKRSVIPQIEPYVSIPPEGGPTGS